jgi:hypothetical protein
MRRGALITTRQMMLLLSSLNAAINTTLAINATKRMQVILLKYGQLTILIRWPYFVEFVKLNLLFISTWIATMAAHIAKLHSILTAQSTTIFTSKQKRKLICYLA